MTTIKKLYGYVSTAPDATSVGCTLYDSPDPVFLDMKVLANEFLVQLGQPDGYEMVEDVDGVSIVHTRVWGDGDDDYDQHVITAWSLVSYEYIQ